MALLTDDDTGKATTDISREPYVLQQIDRAIALRFIGRDKMVAAVAEQQRRKKIKSVFEAAFWVWWDRLRAYGDIPEYRLEGQYDIDAIIPEGHLDFVVLPSWADCDAADRCKVIVPKLAVELDGGKWHERKPSQVMTRDQRDRKLLAAGWEVLHYSYTEFNLDQMRAIQEVAARADVRFGNMRAEIDFRQKIGL